MGESTGFGITPVREALRRLEAENLVVSEDNRGIRVAPLSLHEVSDLENSRLVIELALLKDAIAKGGNDWENQVIATHSQLSKLELPFLSEDLASIENWAEKHRAFHDSLNSAASSKWLHQFQKQINEQLLRKYRLIMNTNLLNIVRSDPEIEHILRIALGIEHHTKLMQAALDRDIGGACKVLQEHVEHSVLLFRESFPKRQHD